MRSIIHQIQVWVKGTDKGYLLSVMLFTALLVWLNYSRDLRTNLVAMPLPLQPVMGYYILYLASFTIPWLAYMVSRKSNLFNNKKFIFLLIVAPLIFSLKMAPFHFTSIWGEWNSFFNDILYWPLRLLMTVMLVAVIGKWVCRDHAFFGFNRTPFNWKPYLLMLLIMVPLIAIAATQADFLSTYPKFKNILPLPDPSLNSWPFILVFELAYALDFVQVEFFFRGFLILAFLRYAGKDAILPMAAFYCAIHFGKPLAECISSFFGGILLGIVVYHSRSIWGGLVVHLGIAWMMELAAFISKGSEF